MLAILRSGESMEIIYCGNGNKRFADIAIEHGFLYGAQLPGTVYHPIFFADQNWKRPNRIAYMNALATHRPHMASVLDWETDEQLPEVLNWAEEAAQYVETVMIIPKVFGGIGRIPNKIGNKAVRLGYSVPTRFGGTEVPIWEFADRPVHLLGGDPQKQMALCNYLNVQSADGNYAHKMAVQFAQFWTPGNARYANSRFWPKLSEAGYCTTKDAMYEAFRRSCENIMAAWQCKMPANRGIGCGCP